jgi:hypothetical protein
VGQGAEPPVNLIFDTDMGDDCNDDGKGAHAQFRRLRMTAQGTYPVPFLQMNKVVEYGWN